MATAYVELSRGAHPPSRATIMSMSALLLGTSFLAFWAGATLLLSCLPWFQQREPLSDRLRPYVDNSTEWVTDVERWLKRQ